MIPRPLVCFPFLVLTGCLSQDDGGLSLSPDQQVESSSADTVATTEKSSARPQVFQETIQDRQDPIAAFFRENAEDDGTTNSTYEDILLGVSKLQGCDSDEIRTFAISDNLLGGDKEGPFPRIVSVACNETTSKAADFFIAASFPYLDEAGQMTGELDLQNLELFAWDKKRKAYQFYETILEENGDVVVDPSPKRCEACHLTPADQNPTAMHMTPIMNELTQPWTHWSANPAFPSHKFVIPAIAKDSTALASLFENFKGTAPELERIIRKGHKKVASARVANRKVLHKDQNAFDTAFGMLRPLFCAEQVNYVSEDHHSARVLSQVVIDPGVRNAFRELGKTWTWQWLHDDIVQLHADESVEALDQIPVRGNADVELESRLISRRILNDNRALAAVDVLRARAYDWKHPVFSKARCELFTTVEANRTTIETEMLAEIVPEERTATNFVRGLYRRMMRLGGHSLILDGEEAAGNTRIIAVDLGSEILDEDATTTVTGAERVARLVKALANKNLETGDCQTDGFCQVTLEKLGDLIQGSIDEVGGTESGRSLLSEHRERRICFLTEKVKPVPGDRRFDNGRVQVECAEECCEESELDACFVEAKRAARELHIGGELKEHEQCAVDCAAPARISAHPALPKVNDDCSDTNRFWQ